MFDRRGNLTVGLNVPTSAATQVDAPYFPVCSNSLCTVVEKLNVAAYSTHV